MELLLKIVSGFYPSTVFAKSSIADVSLDSKYASGQCFNKTPKGFMHKVSKFPNF